jgi:hypothetical protein
MPWMDFSPRSPFWLRRCFLGVALCLAVFVVVIVSISFLAACRGPRL